MAKKKVAAKGKRGRPAGAKSAKAVIVQALRSSCHQCGSTNRKVRAKARPDMERDGTAPNGEAYTHIVWRRCVCKDCGALFVEQTYENRPKKRAKRKTRKKAPSPNGQNG